MGKRIAAVLLVLISLLLCGCVPEQKASILCTEELLPAAKAFCTEENGISYAATESDLAAVQQLESGTADCVLLTMPGYEALMERYDLDMAWSGGMTQFLILSTAGDIPDWTKNTRVYIVGKHDNYADFMAQQVLTCAFYGSLHYEDEETAVSALQSGKADVVMGFFGVQDVKRNETLLSIKNLSLESIPESLLILNLPDEAVEESAVTLGSMTAQSVVVPGVLVLSEKLDENIGNELTAMADGVQPE